jgi:hypothetical protein
MDSEFHRITRLPPYVFAEVNKLKAAARGAGRDIKIRGSTAIRTRAGSRASAVRWPPTTPRRFGVEIDPEREAIVTLGLEGGAGQSRPGHRALGLHVRLGADPGAFPGHGLTGLRQAAAGQGQCRSLAGLGFGEYNDGHVRFALVENEQRTRQALRNIKAALREANPRQADRGSRKAANSS